VRAGPARTEVSVAVPVRACDVGGWTDTWFAERGAVCSLALEPGVSVQARAQPGTGVVTIIAVDYGQRLTVGREPPEHRLLAEAVREAGPLGPVDVEVTIAAAVPPGCSLGTSAAVCVGLVAALDALRGELRPPAELAAAAHRAEAGRLGRQSGVQDQAAAAHGGANLVEVDRYPATTVRPTAITAATWSALDQSLLHVAYGAGHDSSAVHETVIEALTAEGPRSARLDRLRALAHQANRALVDGDLPAYGVALRAATEAQAALHPALVSDAARTLIEAAQAAGALGWKVNGAGGLGGSLSILCRRPADRQRLAATARALGHTPLELALAPHGARLVGP
jgi:D-glycero-alpha-D-manno-heptose-7-phosphate kinase